MRSTRLEQRRADPTSWTIAYPASPPPGGLHLVWSPAAAAPLPPLCGVPSVRGCPACGRQPRRHHPPMACRHPPHHPRRRRRHTAPCWRRCSRHRSRHRRHRELDEEGVLARLQWRSHEAPPRSPSPRLRPQAHHQRVCCTRWLPARVDSWAASAAVPAANLLRLSHELSAALRVQPLLSHALPAPFRAPRAPFASRWPPRCARRRACAQQRRSCDARGRRVCRSRVAATPRAVSYPLRCAGWHGATAG